jgi:hypothetical protein
MEKNFHREYECPHCSQTSGRKYNMQIHMKRKHHPYPLQINNSNPSALVNKSHSLIDFEKSPSDWNTYMQQPSSSVFPPLPPNFTFNPGTFFYYNKMKEDDEKKKRRESDRRFNKTSLEYMQKILIPYVRLQCTQIKYSNRIFPTSIFIDPKHMPKAHRIYKCHKCFMQTLKPFIDYKEIYPANKFIHNCYSNQEQQQKLKDNNETQIKTLKLQEILLSILDSRLKSENKLLKMMIFPDDLIKNSLSLKILLFLMDIMGNGKEDDPLRWLFELLKNERFVDLGEISSQHWARRAYDNDGKYSAKENITKLEKEELKQFISMTEGTFGLIKFKIDDSNKTIYTFSYLPLDNEDN